MNKRNIVRDVARRSRIPQEHCHRVLNAVTEIITECLESGDRFVWENIAIFDTYERQPLRRRDPKNGGVTVFPAKKKLRCTFAKKLKEKVEEDRKEID